MEYSQRPNNPDSSDHENSDYILSSGLNMGSPDESFKIDKQQATRLRYEAAWSALEKLVQDPKRDTQIELAGYTGHRVITLGNPDEKYALGFYLHIWKALEGHNQKLIRAEWRRLYPDDERRVEREVGSETFKCLENEDASEEEVQAAMLRLEILYEKFIAVHGYDDIPELPAAS